MEPITLTIQIYLDGHWHDAAELTLQQPQLGRGGAVRLGYEFDYPYASNGVRLSG